MDQYEVRLARGGAICGLVGTLTYIVIGLLGDSQTSAQVLQQMGTSRHGILPHFLVVGAAVLWAVGFVGFGAVLRDSRFRNAARLGTIFGVVASGMITAMLIVQGSVMVNMGKAFVAAASEAERQGVLTLYRQLRVIDQGLDLAFDVFFFTAWICVAIAMLGHRRFSKTLAVLIIVPFVVDAPIQLYYAPTPPPFDLGPFASFLLLGAYVQALLATRPRAEMARAAAQA